MSERCRQTVYRGSFSRPGQCSRHVYTDGFCKQHHPDTVKARNEKSERDYIAKRDSSPHARLEIMKKQRDELLSIAKRIVSNGISTSDVNMLKAIISKSDGVEDKPETHDCPIHGNLGEESCPRC